MKKGAIFKALLLTFPQTWYLWILLKFHKTQLHDIIHLLLFKRIHFVLQIAEASFRD